MIDRRTGSRWNKLYVMHLARSFSFPLPESEDQTFQMERKDSQSEMVKDREEKGCNGAWTEMTERSMRPSSQSSMPLARMSPTMMKS